MDAQMEVDLKLEDAAWSLALGKTSADFEKKKKPAGGRNRRATSADDVKKKVRQLRWLDISEQLSASSSPL